MVEINYTTRMIELSYFLIRAHFYPLEGLFFWVTKFSYSYILIIEESREMILNEIWRSRII